LDFIGFLIRDKYSGKESTLGAENCACNMKI
jgi:hypothetical protein